MNDRGFKRLAAALLLSGALAVVAAEQALAAIPWHDNLVAAKNASLVSNRPLLVIFTASWSEASDRFVQTTLAAPEAVGLVSACFEAVRLDVDMNPELAKRLRVTHMPTACVIDANEQLLFRFECSESNADFVAYAARAIQHASLTRQAGRPPHAVSLPTSAALPRTVTGAPSLSPPVGFGPPVAVASPGTAAVVASVPAALPAVPGLPATEAAYPATSHPSPTLPPVPEKPQPRKPVMEFFESAASMFKRPTPPADAVADRAAVPPPQPLQPIAAPVSMPGASPAGQVGMEGFCPVTVVEKGQWLAGSAQWGARHRGRTNLFAGPLEQQAFLAAPDRYAPALSGDDPVLALDAGRQVPGERRYGLAYESRIYLFSSQETLDAFTASPGRYTARVAVAESTSQVVPGTVLR